MSLAWRTRAPHISCSENAIHATNLINLSCRSLRELLSGMRAFEKLRLSAFQFRNQFQQSIRLISADSRVFAGNVR